MRRHGNRICFYDDLSSWFVVVFVTTKWEDKASSWMKDPSHYNRRIWSLTNQSLIGRRSVVKITWKFMQLSVWKLCARAEQRASRLKHLPSEHTLHNYTIKTFWDSLLIDFRETWKAFFGWFLFRRFVNFLRFYFVFELFVITGNKHGAFITCLFNCFINFVSY